MIANSIFVCIINSISHYSPRVSHTYQPALREGEIGRREREKEERERWRDGERERENDKSMNFK